MPHHIYCISGLGADFRIFQKLQIADAEMHPIEWTIPEPGETLPEFAKRLSAQIQHEDPILLGVSFGGMLATEISKVKKVKATFVVSSCKRRSELPAYLRLAGKLRLHQVVPYWLATKSRRLNRFIFDPRSKAEELYLKQLMLKHSNPVFLQRAVHMILTWQNAAVPGGIIHIHGRKDKLLTPKNVQANFWINDGGHFMIWNKAPEISRCIAEMLHESE